MSTTIALRPLHFLEVWYVQFTQLRRQLSFPILILLTLLQRTPIVQAILGQGGNLLFGSSGQVLRSGLMAASVLGAVDTLAGATTFVVDPIGNPEGTYAVTAGTPIPSVTFTIIDTPTPVVSWKVQGTLAPGLSIAGLSAGVVNLASPVITGTPTTAGSYIVQVKAYDRINGAGKTDGVWYPITFNVTGAVATAPSITTQPTAQVVTAGNTATFSVAASGTAPLSYQWRFNTVAISGATSSTYSLSNAQSANAGNYSVVVTNTAGNVTSNAVSLTVNVPPSITTQPSAQVVTAGNTATFSVVASGTATLTYQWKFNTASISGATSATYSLTNAQSANAGNYSVVVTNGVGNVTSNAVSLTVNPLIIAPAITTQPSAQVVTAGGTASFTVAASGTAPLSYQWQFNSSPISGANSATYSLSNAQSGNAGNYSVVVSNSAGNATSNVVGLTVNVPPSITTQPSAQVVTAGNTATFSVAASGTATLTYQWLFNSSPISGATSATYSLTNAQSGNAGNYSVVVTNGAGNVTSNVVSLTVNPLLIAPAITTQPSAQVVTAGGTASFTVAASGTATLTYQWQFNSSPISGATSATYSLSNAQSANAGNYSVVVTNGAGNVTSNVVSLTVNPALVAPSISTQPSAQVVTAGNTATFTVVALGSPTLTYQWQFNSSPISGATSATYSLSNAQSANAGNYSVVITNGAGNVTSNVVSLTVNPAVPLPVFTLNPIGGTVVLGQVVVLNGRASGSPTYQWYKDNVLLSGSTSPNLVLDGLVSGSAGSYVLKATNAAGTVSSSAAVLVLGTAARAPVVNMSVQTNSIAGDPFTLGFVVSGATAQTVLIRACGPSLSPMVAGVMTDPMLQVFNSSSVMVGENDDWSASLAPLFVKTGAFAFITGSKDAALVITLPPGNYTVQVKDVSNGSGKALAEVFLVETP